MGVKCGNFNFSDLSGLHIAILHFSSLLDGPLLKKGVFYVVLLISAGIASIARRN